MGDNENLTTIYPIPSGYWGITPKRYEELHAQMLRGERIPYTGKVWLTTTEMKHMHPNRGVLQKSNCCPYRDVQWWALQFQKKNKIWDPRKMAAMCQ